MPSAWQNSAAASTSTSARHAAVALPGGHRVGHEGPELHQPLAQQRRHLGIAAGGHHRLEQQRPRVAPRGRQLVAGEAQSVGGTAGELDGGEQRVDLGGAHGGKQQVGLVAEVGVDGAGAEAGPADDLLDPGALVAPLGEHLGGRGHQPITHGGIRSRGGRRRHMAQNNSYSPA